MKVTAIIADDLVNNVKAYTQSSTVIEAVTIALTVNCSLITSLTF
jgi:hypothetical protein